MNNRWIAIILMCCCCIAFLRGGEAVAMSIDDEKEMGEKFLSGVKKQFRFVEDDFSNRFIRELGQYLVKPVEAEPFPFRFYIIEHSTLNAFAGPGGHIFIFSGLIDIMDELDELAAVLCHEIAHVTARHLSERVERGKKIGLATMAGMLASILIGGKAAGAIMVGTQAAGMQAELAYSRDDERQADQIGFKYMSEAGLDPSAMIDVLQKLLKGQWGQVEGIPPYLLTHPAGAERMANADVMLSNYKVHEVDNTHISRFRKQFHLAKAILKAKYDKSQAAEQYFSRELKAAPTSVTAHFGLGILFKEKLQYDKAIGHFLEALKRESNATPILIHLGEAFQLKGKNRAAIDVLKKALALDAYNHDALFLLALSYQNSGEYQEAIRLYEQMVTGRHAKAEVYYNLGVSYGRQQRLAHAHYYFGVYFKKLDKISKARFHFQKAESLSRNEPELKNLISKASEGLPKEK